MLLVDAYNVLMVTGVLPPDLAGLDESGLASLIAAGRYARREARLICDGTPRGKAPGSASGRVTIVYAGPGREADDVIEALIEVDSAPRRLLVVSTDRRVRKAARRRRAPSMTSDVFLRQLAEDHARTPRKGRQTPPIPLERPAVARWMEEFGFRYDPDHRNTDPPRKTAAAAGQVPIPTPPPVPAPEQAPLDPILIQALEVWSGRLKVSDLDMTRWLDRAFNAEHDKPDEPPRGRRR